MQMLSVKLGVATGLNLAQQCRYNHCSRKTELTRHRYSTRSTKELRRA